jgi:hypothetical protein
MIGRGLNNCPHVNQIHEIRVSFLDARGPNYARTLQQNWLRDEEFCMQVDAHSDVVHDWDTSLTNMWGSINNEYAVLSTVPPDLPDLGKNIQDHWEVNHLCQARFTDK